MYQTSKKLLGPCLVGLGFLVFLPLLVTTGLYFPEALTGLYIGDDGWSNDSTTFQVRAEFPIGSQYKINVDRKEVEAIGFVKNGGYIDEMKNEHTGLPLRNDYFISLLERFGFERIIEVQPSPDGKYLAVIATKEKYYFSKISDTRKEDKYIYLIEVKTRKILFESSRETLIRKIKLKIYNQSIDFFVIEIGNWLIIGLGLILASKNFSNFKDGLKQVCLLFIFCVCLYFFYYLIYILFTSIGSSGF